MARVVIVIEDRPGNKVQVTSNPNCETMIKMRLSGNLLESSHGYAFIALNAIQAESKKNAGKRQIITLPKGFGL